ncbi:PD-(D/E)XK nuclease family protein [Umezawaea sp. NPDC059074]|uniref:PD-(D/E)XK nuclease family protein n=1 Tax=Umezawaea sp. NPDC059074 TaxID=3346716 RepID=UPI0036994A62
MSTITRRWSHSAYEDYASCGEKYRLKRVEKVPDQPGVARVGGKAFHSWTEPFDLAEHQSERDALIGQWPDFLEAAIAEEEEKYGVARDKFTTSGRATKEKPNKEDIPYWRDVLGPELIEKYAKWAGSNDWVIAQDLPQDANGNTVGVEYEVTYRVGQVQEKGYLDRVYYDINGNLGVVDIKTWSRKRVTIQLPGYLVALQKRGVNATWGSYYHARQGKADLPVFYGWDEHKLAFAYEQAAVMEAQGFYLPRVSDDCNWCSVKAHCRFAL